MRYSDRARGYQVIEQSGPVSGVVTFTVAGHYASFVARYDENGIVDVIANTDDGKTLGYEPLYVQAAIADHLCRKMFRAEKP